MQTITIPPASQHTPLLTQFTVARYALEWRQSLNIREALPLAEQLRRALISHRVETTHSETITGKTIEGKPLLGHLHAHYFTTDEDGDGRLDHITVYAPRGFDMADIEALKMIRSIRCFDRKWQVHALLIGIGQAATLDIPLFGPSSKWRSVTPFSLPRFSNRGGGKPPRPRDLPEAQLARELQLRGLPEPVSIERSEGYAVADRPMVRWLDFHTRRFKGDEGHGLAGFEIEFAEAVVGPIALGFASHFSLGLFLPGNSH